MTDLAQTPEYLEATRFVREMIAEIPLPAPRENPRFSDKTILKWGYIYWREVNGGVYAISPMSFGKGRICGELDYGGISEFWCFESLLGAIQALDAWNPEQEGEVEGWIRHFPSHRRRIGGDPSTEHYQP